MTPTPILFLGDSPSLKTGLGRIGRDLSNLLTSLPEFRVGYLGRGGISSRYFPYAQYNFTEIEQWGENLIEYVWNDFAGDQAGAIFTIWDASRLFWFGSPTNALGESLHKFLTSGRFQKWGYFPVDSVSPTGKLSTLSQETLKGYNRKLAYTMWASEIINSTWMPHGTDTTKFAPRDKGARLLLNFKESDRVIGCVMTNQARKDWGLAFATMFELRKHIPVKFWIHVDVMERSNAWSLYSLIADYNAADWTKITFSGNYNDKELSYLYSACDVVILPSLGEGFGYPVIEALSCGIPIITGNYGGSPELVPNKSWLVEPKQWRIESINNCVRPVYDPSDYVETLRKVLDDVRDEKITKDYCRSSIEHLDWKYLWPSCWQKWFLEGLS